MPSMLEHKTKAPLNLAFYVCPTCRSGLEQLQADALRCVSCQCQFLLRSGQPDFRLDIPTLNDPEALDDTEKWQNRIKMQLRKYPKLYRFLVYTISPVLLLGPNSQRFVNNLGANANVLSIGAGVLRLKGNMTHLDYEPYPHLEVVGDAHYLPFPDNAFDGVVCETMLEHVTEPERVIAEIYRVLKPGGKAYLMVPFIYGFHAAPNDFYRFTHKGLLYRTRDFEMEQLKVVSGPTSALACVLVEWCAMLFSLGSRRLYQLLSLVFLVVFAPLKLLDFAISFHPEAIRIASVLLAIVRKPVNNV